MSTDIKSLVDNTIAAHKVVIYSKSYCPYCKQTKATFDDLDLTGDLKPWILELDEVDNGSEQQSYLAEKTGQRTVPNIFIDGNHIGGNSDLQTLKSNGELASLTMQSILDSLESLTDDDVAYKSGISLLTARNETLLQYLLHFTLIQIVQANPSTSLIANQDLVQAIVQKRVVLERIKPLIEKLSYQINKLLEADKDLGNAHDKEAVENDPLSFKPNPEALISSARQSHAQPRETAEEDQQDAIYKPPRLNAVPYELDKRSNKRSSGMAPNYLMQEMATSLNDKTPYSEGTTGLSSIPQRSTSKSKHLSDLNNYEEEMMTRVSMSKKESKKRRMDEELLYGGGDFISNRKRNRSSDAYQQEFGDLLAASSRKGKMYEELNVSRAKSQARPTAPIKKKVVSGKFERKLKKANAKK